jgi:2-polyprenyl-3-methyl-5-hydroxy-6-metoxy-1,4-benzoquinol methylase
MDVLAAAEEDKYRRMWADPDYRRVSPAERDLETFLAACQPEPGQGILDAGCGTGRAAKRLFEAGFNVYMLDITEDALDSEVSSLLDEVDDNFDESRYFCFQEQCLWDWDGGIEEDWFICYDVMEHLPEAQVLSVLENIASYAREGGFFQICTVPDGYGSRIGETLHLTVKPAEWWLRQLSKYFIVVKSEVSDLHLSAAVTPKR